MNLLPLALIALLALACAIGAGAATGRVTVQPADTGAALVNPGMGWVLFFYSNVPNRIVNLAVSEKPILRVAQAYDSIKNNMEFDKIIQGQFPAQVKGTRPDFRTTDLQDQEGAKVGYVVKF